MTTSSTSSKILVVDDEPQIRRVLRTALVAGGYTVNEARSGEEALEKLREERPDLAIVDINLPGMSGFEAVRRLRDWPETRDIPVIGLSAAALPKDHAAAKDAGFYRYLTKPVKVDELMATLEQLLG